MLNVTAAGCWKTIQNMKFILLMDNIAAVMYLLSHRQAAFINNLFVTL